MEIARGIPQVGDVLNARYRLNAKLGEGAFAIAFAGQDMEKKQAIAVKVLNRLTSEKDILQFSEEAYLMVGLEHPNIVPFVDYVPMKEGIRPYIVMKLAVRGSLNDELKKRQQSGNWVPIRRSVLLLDQAGEGLGYLHRRKIVHRDIKPDNLLLAGEEELWLSDFGIAKQLLSDEPSKTGNVAGTPQYMAPEQLRGKPEEASDIYALGVTAYYLFTRRLPFSGGSFYDVMYKQLHETPRSLVEAVQSLSREGINIKVVKALDQVVMRALAKEPDKRHESVTLFTKTLLDEYEQVSGEKPDRTQFEAVKPQPVEKVISEEDRKKKEHYAFLQKGIAFYNQKNYEEALVAFEQAIQLDPKGNFAWYCKGVALNNLGRHEEAIKAYETAMQLDPKDAKAWHNKGSALSLLGRHEEALAAFKKVEELDPSDRDAKSSREVLEEIIINKSRQGNFKSLLGR